MSEFLISGFADEIDSDFETQLKGLNTLSINYIEVRGVNGKNISDLTDQEIDNVMVQLKNYNVKVSSIGSPIGKIGIKDDFAPHLEKFKRVLEIAKRLETNYIRIFSFFMPHGEDPSLYRDEVMKRLQAMVDTAQGSGIIILHENEKDIYGDIPERCLDIFKTIKGEGFAGIFDPANFIQCDAKVYPEGFELLKPYIKYMHIKDALQNGEVVPSGYGIGGLENILSDIKKEGFKGFLSLEPHLGDFVGFAELETSTSNKKTEKSGFDKFEIAHTALVNILNKI